MINLNDDKFGGIQIFNNGVAGMVKDVTIEVEKKTPSDPDNLPDYKLLAVDSSGAKVNQGFYYFTPNPKEPQDRNDERQKQEISRIVHLAKAVMGSDYVLPQVESIKEAYDTVFKLVKENAAGKKYNVFCTYGTTRKPSNYLGIRYFNFIEPATNNSTLKRSNTDLLEKVQADAVPSSEGSSSNWV